MLSRKEAALALGMSRQRLEALLKQGRITETDAGIDLDVASREYERTLDPDKRAIYLATKGGKRVDAAAAVAVATPAVIVPGPASAAVQPPEGGEASTETPPPADLFNFAEARTRKESWNASLAELKYKEQAGQLIRREEVAAKEFAVARKLRDRILGFPSRLATYVPPEAMQVLTDECDQLVRELQEDAASVAESGTAA